MKLKKGIYFSEVFDVSPDLLAEYGAFNVSPWMDMPLFIDPFLLFANEKPEYQALHDEIITYLKYLREDSVKSGPLSAGRLKHLYCFKEVHQNCLGFSLDGTKGLGLGPAFGKALHNSLNGLFGDFGEEQITQESHLEKLSLIQPGVGRDKISDLTTNLIKGYLLAYTETFAKKYIDPSKLKFKNVEKSYFNFELGAWMSKGYWLPFSGKDYVILTPEDILTQDDIWINKEDLRKDFHHIKEAISNIELRDRVGTYFQSKLPKLVEKNSKGHMEVIPPTAAAQNKAIQETIRKFPELVDYFIKYKEQRKGDAVLRATQNVTDVKSELVESVLKLITLLKEKSDFFKHSTSSLEESRRKIEWFRHVIEDQDGYKAFYHNGKPIKLESKFQAMFKLVWENSEFSCDAEVNNGRGPVDFKVSKGSGDQTLIEFKLASNSQLRSNLENQVNVYKKASGSTQSFTVVVYFSEDELTKIQSIVTDLDEAERAGIVLVDARSDNKPSASKTRTLR